MANSPRFCHGRTTSSTSAVRVSAVLFVPLFVSTSSVSLWVPRPWPTSATRWRSARSHWSVRSRRLYLLLLLPLQPRRQRLLLLTRRPRVGLAATGGAATSLYWVSAAGVVCTPFSLRSLLLVLQRSRRNLSKIAVQGPIASTAPSSSEAQTERHSFRRRTRGRSALWITSSLFCGHWSLLHRHASSSSFSASHRHARCRNVPVDWSSGTHSRRRISCSSCFPLLLTRRLARKPRKSR